MNFKFSALTVFFIILSGLSIDCWAQKKTVSTGSGSQFVITIEHNGQKKEVRYTQFQTADGNAMAEGVQNGRLLLFYGASNSKDEKSFSFQGWIPKPEKGVYELGEESESGAGFNFRTTEFNDVPMFLPKSGSMEITAVPQKGGFVEGTFSIVCENVKDDGSTEIYNISGSFKLKRM